MDAISPQSSKTEHSVSDRPWLLAPGLIVAVLAAIKLAVHLYTGRRYGFFVDELYYLDSARHLDWGYVDQPPLVALVAWFERHLLGDSLLAIRIIPLSGVTRVLFTAFIARELGGGRSAQVLSALSILLAPGFLGVDHFLSMNSFEPIF